MGVNEWNFQMAGRFRYATRLIGHLLRGLGTGSRLLVSDSYHMSRNQKLGAVFTGLVLLGLFLHELRHFYRYGHFVPFGLHADVSVTTSKEVLGVEGVAKIYRARLTNYGVLPSTVVVCSERVASTPESDVNYIVERWDRQSGSWRAVPEWDFGGDRLFCAPVFEATEQHLARMRVWPGQTIEFGEGIPAQMGGFNVGDDGRFTVFLNADGDRRSQISTSVFRVDQQAKKRHVPNPN
jgi:hypothetical protein